MSGRRESARDAWLLMFEFFESQKNAFFALAEECGVTPIQLHLLRALDTVEFVPMGQTVVARACDRSTLTRLVDRLVSEGLVERRESEIDRRVKEIRLTAKGGECRDRIDARLKTPPRAMAQLSEEDLQALIEILGRVVRTES